MKEESYTLLPRDEKTKGRVLVIANRLPMTVQQQKNGSYTYSKSSGGLVSGLSGIRNCEMLWIGWPGNDIPPEHQQEVTQETLKNNCLPVFLEEQVIENYYNGFANNILWPLFHYITPPLSHSLTDSVQEQEWEAYKFANIQFAHAIQSIYRPNDLIWVHDYHLMLVPQYLRQTLPNASIGWFLHTPFPSLEYFRLLPVRNEILTGVLSANLIGFHCFDYCSHFLSCSSQLLGLETTSLTVNATSIGGVFAFCATIPIGIEPTQFLQKMEERTIREAMGTLKGLFKNKILIIGVDRLDYMKGLPHKLASFDRFLSLYPEYKQKLVLFQLAVPSRINVIEYQKLRSAVHEQVASINARHGTVDGLPIHYLDASLSFDSLVTLYSMASICLITSIRDGMNLVAYEYVTCQKQNHGVLILSEFAGAAKSLGSGALLVNPWDMEEVAEAIHTALTLPKEKKKQMHDNCMEYVLEHTSETWAKTFIQHLEKATLEGEINFPEAFDAREASTHTPPSSRRLFLICGDVLEDYLPKREMAVSPSLNSLPVRSAINRLKTAIETLAEREDTFLILLSRLDPSDMDQLFGSLPPNVILGSQDGCYIRLSSLSSLFSPVLSSLPSLSSPVPFSSSGSFTWYSLLPPQEKTLPQYEWYSSVLDTLHAFSERTPGSSTLLSPLKLRWTYHPKVSKYAKQMGRQLCVHLLAGPLPSAKVDLCVGKNYVDLRLFGLSQEYFLRRFFSIFSLSLSFFDFRIAFGSFPCAEVAFWDYWRGAERKGSERKGERRTERGEEKRGEEEKTGEERKGREDSRREQSFFEDDESKRDEEREGDDEFGWLPRSRTTSSLRALQGAVEGLKHAVSVPCLLNAREAESDPGVVYAVSVGAQQSVASYYVASTEDVVSSLFVIASSLPLATVRSQPEMNLKNISGDTPEAAKKRKTHVRTNSSFAFISQKDNQNLRVAPQWESGELHPFPTPLSSISSSKRSQHHRSQTVNISSDPLHPEGDGGGVLEPLIESSPTLADPAAPTFAPSGRQVLGTSQKGSPLVTVPSEIRVEKFEGKNILYTQSGQKFIQCEPGVYIPI